jgi:hypothetical protein
MLQLATLLRTIEQVRTAASSEAAYALDISVQTTGGVNIDFRMFDKYEELSSQSRFAVDKTNLTRHLVKEAAGFRPLIGEAERDLLHATGVNMEHDWEIEFLE